MLRSFVLIFAALTYYGLLLLAVGYEMIASTYFFGNAAPAVFAAMSFALYIVFVMAIPLLVRWKLRNVSWGTLARYLTLLTVAWGLQTMYQELIEEQFFSFACGVLFFGNAVLAVFCMAKNIQYHRALTQADRARLLGKKR